MSTQLEDVNLSNDLSNEVLPRPPSVSDGIDNKDDATPPNASAVPAIAISLTQGEGIFARQSRRVARSPCYYLLGSLIVSIGLGAIGMIVGEFSVSANNGGWQSRGTLIANRETQSMLVSFHLEELFTGDEAVWNRLLNTVLPGWEDDDDDDSGRRALGEDQALVPSLSLAETWQDYLKPKADRILMASSSPQMPAARSDLPFDMTPRLLQDLETSLQGRGCDTNWYTPQNLTQVTRLWPIWKTTSFSKSILDPAVLRDICLAESKTQAHLEANGLCFGCDEGCLPPYSIVMYARLVVANGWSLSCEDLAEAWAPLQPDIQVEWSVCVQDIKKTYDPTVADQPLPASCPPYFSTTLVEEAFDTRGGQSQYTSSIFATSDTIVDTLLYDNVEHFDTAGSSSLVDGAYDTQYENFNNIYLDDSLLSDMALALGSALVVAVAILVHSRSPFITLIGLVQIILSFPLSYLVYNLMLGLEFFPFLNFIGIFVVFALGAGDIFVAVDKWKNARLQSPTASTEDIAATALPDAALAMFLTTLTTAVAFFSTAICPVAPITMFAIFCGLLIVFDYVMNVVLIFPALCIWDRSLQANGIKGSSCFILCSCFGLLKNKDIVDTTTSDGTATTKELALDDDGAEDLEATTRTLGTSSGRISIQDSSKEEKPSLTTRIFTKFYDVVHATRWPLLVACMAALSVCIYYSTTLQLPLSSDVRLLSDKEQFEQNYLWRQNLLVKALEKSSGSQAYMLWGLKPADTGDHTNPSTWSELVLDESFDSSSPDAQLYLRDYCESLMEQDFAKPLDSDFICPLTRFDSWLEGQSSAAVDTTANTTAEDLGYVQFCNGATGIPMEASDWDGCLTAWAQANNEMTILSRSNKVTIISIPFLSRVRYDEQYDILDDEWHLIENWVKKQNSQAPASGVDSGYFTSFDFWWYDTNGQMLATAYSSAAIALLCAAFVILATSKSFILTFFCTLTIGYVLTSVTAMLVAIGWTLGFLESICFAILIGVSVDFCIHLAHAYANAASGDEERGVRIKYALVHMGPSIMATAATTILSAVVMLFTVITFFQKFALILFLTIVQASIGSFIVFVVLADCFGPRNPTYVVDRMAAWWSSRSSKNG